MNLTRDRQGFLEDVNSMTLPQLKDLLERQEKILMKKKFVANLPDKGEKSRQFADKLREVIAIRCGGNVTENNSRLSNDTVQLFSEESSNSIKDKDNITIETLVTRNETDIAYSSEDIGSMDTNPSGDLAQRMQELSVGSKPPQDRQPPPTNSYERVIKKVEENPSSAKTKFLPNRSKKDKGSSNSHSTAIKPRAQSSKVPEESAVYPPSYSHESTKLISVEESVQLIQEQRLKTEQLAVERAAQRLAEHFTPKMEAYQPSSVDMRYRQAKVDGDDVDEDDEDAIGKDGEDDDDQDSDDVLSDEENDDDVDDGL